MRVGTCFPSHNLVEKNTTLIATVLYLRYHKYFDSTIKVCFHILVIISMFPESDDSRWQLVYSACLSFAFIYMAFICYDLTMYFTKSCDTQIDNRRPQTLSPGYVLFPCTDVRSKASIKYGLVGVAYIALCEFAEQILKYRTIVR